MSARLLFAASASARARFFSASSGAAATEFSSSAAYESALRARGSLPRGFRVGASTFSFSPAEIPGRTAQMTATLIALDAPTPSVAALFTRNAFPGAPVTVGRARLAGGGALQAIVINNKISNVCAPDGVASAEAVCAGAARALGLASPSLVLPCSTGIIGWRIPVDALVAAIPATAATLQSDSVVPAARGICTTDLFPKIRAETLPGGARIVGIAKGAEARSGSVRGGPRIARARKD
jgi:glutamate N-acetyltransferase/amino-acid N-acetyltransferase